MCNRAGRQADTAAAAAAKTTVRRELGGWQWKVLSTGWLLVWHLGPAVGADDLQVVQHQ
jgi:hypothetical protein